MRSDRVDGATLDLSERSTALAVKSSDTAKGFGSVSYCFSWQIGSFAP